MAATDCFVDGPSKMPMINDRTKLAEIPSCKCINREIPCGVQIALVWNSYFLTAKSLYSDGEHGYFVA